MNSRYSLYFALAALSWSAVGILAGFTLAYALGMSLRQATFFASLGLGVAWFGLSGFYGRRNSGSRSSIASPSAKQINYRTSLPDKSSKRDKSSKKVVSGVLSPQESREWIDQFLVRQQRKSKE